MATFVNIGTQSQVTAATSMTVTGPSATAGNTIVLMVSWLDVGGGAAETLATPTGGWTVARSILSAFSAGIGACGWSVFFKTSAGGVDSPVVRPPTAGSNLYANAIISQWSGMGVHDTADASATIINNTAASTTGTTVPNTATLASANSTIFTGVAITAGTGRTNAGIAFSGGSWTTDVSDQNSSTTVACVMGRKVVSVNAALGAVYTWTADTTMRTFQAGVVVMSDAVTARTPYLSLMKVG